MALTATGQPTLLPSAHLKVADVFLVSGSQNDKVGLLHLKVLCLAVICIAGCTNVGVLQDRATTLYRECRGAGDQSKPVSCHASVRQSLAAAKFCDRRWPIRGPVKVSICVNARAHVLPAMQHAARRSTKGGNLLPQCSCGALCHERHTNGSIGNKD